MKSNAIVFALSNPSPEVDPQVAKDAGAGIIATGRSDYPNQLNNILVFPGLFRGVFDGNIIQITDDHKLAAAKAIAYTIAEPTADMIIPDSLDPTIANIVAQAVMNA